MEILTIVEGQIDNIHHELEVHMKQMAQLQVEVDDVREKRPGSRR
jgi:hypothetical protein